MDTQGGMHKLPRVSEEATHKSNLKGLVVVCQADGPRNVVGEKVMYRYLDDSWSIN
jgi:hypothetical protein